MTTLVDRLAAGASGSWNREAAIWLLAEHGHWINELDRLRFIREEPNGLAFVGWDTFFVPRLVATGSQAQVLNIARALAAPETKAPLGNLATLNPRTRVLVMHALAWAMAGRAYADSLGLLKYHQECPGCGYDPHGGYATRHHAQCPEAAMA